jgi:hypothetical protein
MQSDMAESILQKRKQQTYGTLRVAALLPFEDNNVSFLIVAKYKC